MAMPRPTVLLKKTLIFVHRWLGVALSVIFFLWFASGIVMMYWSFPEVSQEDRLQRTEHPHYQHLDEDPAHEQEPGQGDRLPGAPMPPPDQHRGQRRGNGDHATQRDAAEHRAAERQSRGE